MAHYWCCSRFLINSEKREARSEKREARSEKREARSEKRENIGRLT
ncbi:hypothetical protein L1D52_07000 [Vibrio brasiliensis]|nr:hypothetical protein [Vibrio brasiliensis]MCG9782100.1 hypothetical protein [Vibrio brasiliensis]